MTVDSGYAAWLKTDARYATATVAGASAAWGDKALDSKIISPLANQSDAVTEGAAQAAFLAGPLARDSVVVPGLRKDLLGRLVTITADRLGYEAGADVFVIGVRESDSSRMTTLTVLKRLT